MGQARQVIDRMTGAMVNRDLITLAALYAPDAVIDTPDEGEVKGREQIVRYLTQYLAAFPDLRWEEAAKHESGDTSIDEGWVVGTNTGPLALPSGETHPATGRFVRVRECDIATVAGGVVTSHRFYYDQMDVLRQLGLLPEEPAEERPRRGYA